MLIPKKIHYCWFGCNQMTELTIKCIDSWKRYHPSYELILWNEDNFDININQYVKEAYNAKKYAFVSDYARFYILYKYGGIYLDTDVEVLKPLDDLLENKAFMGFEDNENVAPGLIIGAQKNNYIIKEIMESYDDRIFIMKDGNYNQITVVKYTTDILLKYGLKQDNSLQEIKNMKIYPITYFCPISFDGKTKKFSDNTYTIHHFHGSWLSRMDKFKKRITNILGPDITRILVMYKHKLIKR